MKFCTTCLRASASYQSLISSLRWCQIHSCDCRAARGIALQHHNLLVIPKGPEWQVVYDAKHSKGRTVHLTSNTVINRHANGSYSVQLLRPTSEESLTLAARNRSFNSLLPSKRTFRASAVDYSNSKHFRQYLRKWGAAARLAWIDCSSACCPACCIDEGFV